MENASKALIMAGSVLLGIIIIGALLLMSRTITAYQNTDIEETRTTQVLQFNSQYETYNRTDVRGSDLYSLINKVIDYNERKANNKEIQYEEMTIEFSFKTAANRKNLSYENNNLIFTKNKYSTKTDNINSLLLSKIESIEAKHSKDQMTNLIIGIENLFDKTTDTDIETALNLWNNNSSKKITYNSTNMQKKYKNELNTDENKKDMYTYYEYIYFKRAHFDCTKTEYNTQTGRIIKMTFEFNGKIE